MLNNIEKHLLFNEVDKNLFPWSIGDFSLVSLSIVYFTTTQGNGLPKSDIMIDMYLGFKAPRPLHHISSQLLIPKSSFTIHVSQSDIATYVRQLFDPTYSPVNRVSKLLKAFPNMKKVVKS